MGGDNSPENIMVLSIEEHAKAHKELYEKFGKIQDYKAYKILLGESESDVMNSPEVRKKMSETHKICMLGNTNGSGNKGRHNSESVKKKISEKTKEAMNDPLIREKYLKAKNSPESVKKHLDGVNRTRHTAAHLEATHSISFIEKSKNGNGLKRMHSDEIKNKKNKTLKSFEYRKRQSEIMKASWAKRKGVKNETK